MNDSKIPFISEMKTERIEAPLSLQFLLALSLLFNVYDGLLGFPFRKPFYASLTVVLLTHVFLLRFVNRLHGRILLLGSRYFMRWCISALGPM